MCPPLGAALTGFGLLYAVSQWMDADTDVAKAAQALHEAEINSWNVRAAEFQQLAAEVRCAA